MADMQPATLKKKLPFKRTVARKQQSDLSAAKSAKAEDDSDLELFRHSKEVFNAIIQEAEEEERRKSATPENRERKRRKTSLDANPTRNSPGRVSHELSPLRRSVTQDESDDDLIMDVKGKGKEIIRPGRAPAPKRPTSRSTSRTVTRSPSFTAAVTGDHSDDGARPTASPSRRRKSNGYHPPPRRQPPRREYDSDDDSPIEILPPVADIKGTKPSNKSNSSDSDIEEIPPQTDNAPDEFSEWVAKAREMQEKSKLSAIVNCFLTSRLPGAAAPVVARRRLNQGVALMLEVWVDTQRNRGIVVPDDVARNLFLTWKGNKIYSQSTIASLGVQVDAHGQLKGGDGEGYKRGGIHLEVWTEEAYQEWLVWKGREQALKLGALDDEEDGGEEGRGAALGAEGEGVEEPVAVQQKKKGIKVVLKAKDYEALKLTAKEDSTIETLVEVFRTQREVGPEWDVAIYFDGERLEEDSLVNDADIDVDDINQFEVHIRQRGG
ncbi:hypothetical protein MMYC01_202211 [Madurella mycetomatis]|uniref:Ubiquitin-like domain-containing protein n=1 Tax=Madurella mycetomatis TaxID=100816 RepID=A0A175WD89_9PEZI|nr:hypothetical protein MMYC01_202211 [Madurella mycetomatis]